ncbi:glycine--tRNA ligase [Candidatus Karelsulcia muelleri]|uniref:glycine--tRNA ligase n=1 Tax=Candidatus Karelsulcia muelleri TaxID=336810 RepID=UPI002364188D|nr:glycine--tRNA ligase [Candidatus Karelsulcia muelleri]WDE42171.1 glycine--tRNA ligase [Candidatus Karelsulcia muelleri]WDR79160.1 glycine--tRNA ligase [Candidatus Karelsulcia muelleri]
MRNHKISLKEIVSYAKKYGFIFPTSEIYDGINAIYDYGPYGIHLKNNIKEYWWRSMIQINENIIGLDTSILMHPKIWKASGHAERFKEIFLYNKSKNYSYRLDFLLEKIFKPNSKGDNYLCKKFCKIKTKKNNLKKRIIQYIADNIVLKKSKKILVLVKKFQDKWNYIYEYKLMFQIDFKKQTIYLRPETAQGIFTNFLNVQNSRKLKIPFGIAQIGKVFRNEIMARQFIFRMREFEQMEMQFFIHHKDEDKWFKYWKNKRLIWHLTIGLGEKKYRYFEHEQLAHYAKQAYDIQFNFPFGFKELEGIHSRRNFDLKKHEKYSKKKLRVFDKENQIYYIPYIIETSVGIDRIFLAILSSSLKMEVIKQKTKRTVLKINPSLAPVKAAIFPLIQDKRLIAYAKYIFNSLKSSFLLTYEENDSIGKRYRRQDAIGTPICVTIDFKTLKDKCVTIRYRDSMLQKRVLIKNLKKEIKQETSIKKLLTKFLMLESTK